MKAHFGFVQMKISRFYMLAKGNMVVNDFDGTVHTSMRLVSVAGDSCKVQTISDRNKIVCILVRAAAKLCGHWQSSQFTTVCAIYSMARLT